MSRLRALTAALVLAPAAASALDTAEVELRFGGLSSANDPFSAARLSVEVARDYGGWGLQFGATLSHLSDADQNAARVIAFRDIGAFRLGLSAARVSFDGVQSNTAAFSFHALWTAPGARIDATLTAPDHLGDTGAFSYDISGEQALGRHLTVTTDLYRLTTDLEQDDFWSIALGLRRDLGDRAALTLAGVRSTADDDNFDNRLARLALDWRVTDHATLSATLVHLLDDDDRAQTGLELRLTRTLGAATDTTRLFDSGPLPDRFAIGAFEP